MKREKDNDLVGDFVLKQILNLFFYFFLGRFDLKLNAAGAKYNCTLMLE